MSATGLKQNHTDVGYYINVGSLNGVVYSLNTTSGALTLSTANWANTTPQNTAGGLRGNMLMSSILVPSGGAILKDMGRTVVSSLRTFRKVQLVVPNSNPTLSTFGVRGQSGTTGEDFLTGYIELGFEGNGTPAPVAHFGR
jgi:hypothetical protein